MAKYTQEIINNKTYSTCVLTNKQGVEVEIVSYGAIIRRWIVPTAQGPVDIVLGKEKIADIIADGSCSSFVVGRVANRIANGTFKIGEKTYKVEQNQGTNTLHSASGNYAKKNWTMGEPFVKDGKEGVELTYHDSGEGNFPGEADVKVTYTLDAEGTLALDFSFLPTAATPVNLTSHAYFNLNGHRSNSLKGHWVQVNADGFLPGDPTGLPEGRIEPVAGTAMDLREFVELETAFKSDYSQIVRFGGFDNNYCVAGEGFRLMASAVSKDTKLRLDVYSDLPGVQLYTTNIGEKVVPGKEGVGYSHHAAFCLETQFYPDAINVPAFKGKVCEAGKEFTTRTEFRISHF